MSEYIIDLRLNIIIKVTRKQEQPVEMLKVTEYLNVSYTMS